MKKIKVDKNNQLVLFSDKDLAPIMSVSQSTVCSPAENTTDDNQGKVIVLYDYRKMHIDSIYRKVENLISHLK